MEVINEIGFMNFWGVTPSFNILSEYKTEDKKIVNVLISDSNDIRHIIKTSYFNFISNTPVSINFYIFEKNKENIARALLLLYIINDCRISIRERMEIFLETYGNTLVMARTSEYISIIAKLLNKFVTQDIKYKCPLHEIVDLSNLLYKEIDEISNILSMWDNNFKFDIQKYREDRIRYKFKDRYDHRDNLIDWDHQMNMIRFAPIVRSKHYLTFRNTGVSFEPRMGNYSIPNKTLASYIPGQKKTNRDNCLVLGFWGDIINSPYIGFGIELDNKIEHDFFYKNDTMNYKYDSQDVSEYNFLKYIFRMEKDEIYDFMTKKSEGEKDNDQNEFNKEEKKVLEEEIGKLSFNDKKDEILINPLQGLKNSKFETKIIMLSGDLENISKKKKFKNIFDIVLVGFHSKNIFTSIPNLVKNEESIIFLETNRYIKYNYSHMTAFNDNNKNSFIESLKELTKKHDLVQDESFKIKYMNKYNYKKTVNMEEGNVDK